MADGIKGYVFLDESTDFIGDIDAEVVILEGRLKGVVHALRGLHLKKGAYIEGEIHTANFTAEKGASCKSELYVNTEKEDKADEPGVEVTPTGTQNEKSNLF